MTLLFRLKSSQYAHHVRVVVLLLFCALQCRPTYGQQNNRYSFSIEKTSLENAIQQVRKKTGATIVFKKNEINGLSVANAKFDNATVSYVLHTLVQMLPLTIKEQGGAYFIVPKVVVPRTEPKTNNTKKNNTIVVNGIVTDAETGQPLVGAAIKLHERNAGTFTNTLGEFTINVSDSSVLLDISFVNYELSTIKIDPSTKMAISLKTANSGLNAVTVVANRRTNTEKALLDARRKAAVISDGISAQNIEKTGSITTTQALQRVTGVTITDDKYVAVRGLGDRSVIGQLNGARLASSDPDKSAIPLDLVPANLLDNITVLKTMTPDMPADASGGIVELKTKSIPTRQTLSITAQTGFNSNIGILGNVNSFYNSNMGFLGQKIKSHDLKADFTNLGKQYPGGFQQIQQMIASAGPSTPTVLAKVDDINRIMHHFDPVLTTRYQTAPLNGIYNISYGNSFKFSHNQQLGIILSATYYSRSTNINDGTLNQYSIYQGVMTGNPAIDESRNVPAYITPNKPGLGKYVGYSENTGNQTVSYGLLGGLSYRFNANHQISFQYMGSRGGETQATSLSGQYAYTTGLNGPVYSNIYSLKQMYRTLNTYNLQGEHRFGSGKYAPRLSYNAATSRSAEDDPDYRFVNLADYRPVGGGYYEIPTADLNRAAYVATTDHYALVSGYVNGYGPYGKIQADPNSRRFRNLSEKNYNYRADLTLPFGLKGLDQAFKLGVNYLYRERNFVENVLYLPGSNFSVLKQIPLYQSYGYLDKMVGYDKIGIHLNSATTPEGAPLVSGFLYNSQKSPNNYKGFYETNALYGMADFHLMENLRLAGGVRFEKTNIQSKVDTSGVYIDPSISQGGVNLVYINPISKYITKYKPYYSANLTYTLNDRMNIRLGYSTTLARPEIRERTNVFEFDAFQQALVVGNPDLQNQETQSYDFRWEWFTNPGEVLSVSAFRKEIRNQLQKVFIQNSDGTNAVYPEFPIVEYRNDPNKGHVWGIEAEIVKDLGLLYAPLRNFYFGANLLVAQSSILKNTERLNAARIIDRQSPNKSPLPEQAPYSVNTFLNYDNKKSGTDLTLTFNMVGERLIQVNMDGSPDLYSRPAPVLDFVFSQRLTKRLTFKGYIKNLFNPAFQEVYSNPNTGGVYYGSKYLRRSFKRGSEIMFGVTYDVF